MISTEKERNVSDVGNLKFIVHNHFAVLLVKVSKLITVGEKHRLCHILISKFLQQLICDDVRFRFDESYVYQKCRMTSVVMQFKSLHLQNDL